MKQREARGAASPRREQEQKEEDRRTEWPGGREPWKGRGRTRELILCVKQILFGQRAADGERAYNGRKRAARKKHEQLFSLVDLRSFSSQLWGAKLNACFIEILRNTSQI